MDKGGNKCMLLKYPHVPIVRKRQIFLRIFYFPGFLYNCR